MRASRRVGSAWIGLMIWASYIDVLGVMLSFSSVKSRSMTPWVREGSTLDIPFKNE